MSDYGAEMTRLFNYLEHEREVEKLNAEISHLRAANADLKADRNCVARDMQLDIGRLQATNAELLAALEGCVKAYDAYRARGVLPAPKEYAAIPASIEVARAAIAKAKPPGQT